MPSTLPPDSANLRPLLDRPAVQDLARVLGADQVRLVGGCVRDACLGRAGADLDACTPVPPDELMERLRGSTLFRAYPTGIDHGTVTAFHLASAQRLEVTTLRQDVKTDGRHARVAFGASWAQDAARRDFTFNALMLDLRGHLYDDFGGWTDLVAGRVQFIGDPAARLREDWLRALRYVRFWARFGHEPPDTATRQALRTAATRLKRLSVERIWRELKGLVVAPGVWTALDLFEDLGFADALGLTLERLDSCPDVRTLSPAQIWGALLGSGTQATLRRLRASRAEQAAAVAVARALASHESWFARQVRYGTAAAVAAHRWRGLDGNLTVAAAFPITGQDLRDRGFAPGPELGQALQALREHWIRTEGQGTRADLLAWLSKSTT